MAGQLQGRVAMITGAGRGIGVGIANVLASRGAAVAVCDLDGAAAEETANAINTGGGTAIAGAVDVTDPDSLEHFAGRAISELGAIDICVPNAGVIGGPGFASRKDFTKEDWEMTFAVNVHGVANTTEAVKEHMKDRRQGKIVIIASHGGRKPRGIGDRGRGTSQQPYLVSKAAAIQLTHLLAIELGSFNINVNAVCPGRLWTPMWEAIAINHKALNPTYAELTPHEIFIQQIKATMPLGRPQTPEDIGKTVAFLASDDASEITGQAINVNGGAAMD
ncbi:MAG: SDR family NAD(P)-dependent oxidoreductase [Chloroflexi bacterium]|nr:SDR family NAD(P)-dependent oxidoreductase [Chloroflexota bacterium]